MNRAPAKIAVMSDADLAQLVSDAVQAGVRQALSGLKSEPSEMGEHEAAQYLGVAAATLRTWRCQKRGPVYHKSGRAARYSRSDLDRWIRENRVLTLDSPEARRETSC